MKNFAFLLSIIVILFISGCEPPVYTFQSHSFDAGSLVTPAQYTECQLMPQFSFEKDEAMEIIVKCEENTSY